MKASPALLGGIPTKLVFSPHNAGKPPPYGGYPPAVEDGVLDVPPSRNRRVHGDPPYGGVSETHGDLPAWDGVMAFALPASLVSTFAGEIRPHCS